MQESGESAHEIERAKQNRNFERERARALSQSRRRSQISETY